MIFSEMSKIFLFIIFLNIFIFSSCFSKDQTFDKWLINFKKEAIASGVSKFVVDDVMADAKFSGLLNMIGINLNFTRTLLLILKKELQKKK